MRSFNFAYRAAGPSILNAAARCSSVPGSGRVLPFSILESVDILTPDASLSFASVQSCSCRNLRIALPMCIMAVAQPTPATC